MAPPSLIERFETAKQSTDLTSGILDQHVVYEAVRRGVVDALAPQLRALYAHKRDVMEQAIRAHLGDRLTWSAPKGGFFIWATLPERLDGSRAARARARARPGLRRRQRVLRRRQRPRQDPPVVLGADARAHRRRREAPARRRSTEVAVTQL